MKKLALIAVAFVATTTLSMAAIGGSAHDFSGTAWTNEICAPCHVPHKSAGGTYGYLWDHEVTTANHTVYYRTGMHNADPNGAPTGADTTSILCLSCHDGTVSVDAFGGVTPGTSNIDSYNRGGAETAGYADLGIALGNDHPINVSLTTAETNDSAGYKDVTTAEGLGIVTESGLVTCASCHDVHNNGAAGAPKLLRINNNGSNLCLACHTK